EGAGRILLLDQDQADAVVGDSQLADRADVVRIQLDEAFGQLQRSPEVVQRFLERTPSRQEVAEIAMGFAETGGRASTVWILGERGLRERQRLAVMRLRRRSPAKLLLDPGHEPEDDAEVVPVELPAPRRMAFGSERAEHLEA